MSNEDQLQEVLQRLAEPVVTKEVIALLAIRLFQLRYPENQVRVITDEELQIETSSGGTYKVYLTNMLAECQCDAENRCEIVERYLRVAFAQTTADRSTTLDNIVTLVRDESYLSIFEDRSVVATKHFVGDLWLVMARDDAESITTLSQEDADKFEQICGDLFSLGIANVSKLLVDWEASPYGRCFTLNTRNLFFASTAMAIHSIWDSVADLVQGDITVGIPASDTLLFCGSGDMQGLEELRREVEYVLRNGHHLVSSSLFRRTAGKWHVFS